MNYYKVLVLKEVAENQGKKNSIINACQAKKKWSKEHWEKKVKMILYKNSTTISNVLKTKQKIFYINIFIK